ncbi:hypothetical protein NQ318_021527 [Aromia moschata]|uniref:Timeless N-terminal domain-containing protein n=1 Tax=Aromia moschata TaxID=1265417 RepID=A0AAV8ZEX5_9CUCU|nr:hypothetical protein NQ318_021527 [Aromia moschata]
MASLLSFELSSACSSLGVFDKVTRKYHPGAHVLESLKNIIRFMRKDNEDFDVRRQLGETKVVQTDIIPILRSCWEQSDIFGAALRVAINLSSPTYLLWPEGISKQKGIRKQYLQVEGHLRAYKEAFTEETVWVSISTKLSSILEIAASVIK